MENCVSIKLTKEEIIIDLSEDATQEKIIPKLKEKMIELKRLYQNEKTPIRVTGKELNEQEKSQIKNIIKSEIDVEVKFNIQNSLGLYGIKKVFDKEIESSQTKFYKGGLRSGQKIEYEGSIVVLGDVNGGAEIIAGENIVILGILRGLAHAGAKGNKKAIISANQIESPQIRIANILKEMPKKSEIEGIIKYAYVEGEEIMLE